MGNPDFITITGADDRTPIGPMLALSKRYPIEWGILQSATKNGQPRYPADIARFVGRDALRLSLHLCGQMARDVVAGELTLHLRDGIPPHAFQRVQINHASLVPVTRAANFADHHGIPVIVQCMNFPADGGTIIRDHRVFHMLDHSAGRGISPAYWPDYPGYMCGYAGGLGPDTIADALQAITRHMPRHNPPYWLDMESGVRTDDVLDFAKIAAVCRTVWGHL